MLATAGCSQAATQENAPLVTLTRNRPVQEVAVPAGIAPKAVTLRLEPRTGQPPFGVEAWLTAPGRAAIRLGAVAPYPPGEPGDFRLAWPAALSPAPAGAKLRLQLRTETALGAPQTMVTVLWR